MNTESLLMLIQDQILSIDNVEIEDSLREVLNNMDTPGIERELRMCASFEKLTLQARFDIFGKAGKLIKTIRVPANEVPMLKEELKRQDWFNRLIAEVGSREQKKLDELLLYLKREIDK